MSLRVALIYPPTCDPTAPYLAVPALTGWLRAHDVEVVPIDANVEAYDWLLRRDVIQRLAAQVEERLAVLDGRASLSHQEQLAYATLWRARGDAAAAPGAIDDAVALLRDRSATRFYDADSYEGAVASVESALRVASAAYAPLAFDMVGYRTPFSLLDADEIARDAAPDRNPFHQYFVEQLVPRLRSERVGVVGLSVAFPGQLQPAYSIAHLLRAALPDVHITVGGPAITQLLIRLKDHRLERAIGPFHSAVAYEGEHALLALVRALERGEDPCPNGRLIKGTTVEDMSTLPAPDFEGLPLAKYFAPELVLPYDPTRGCYWGVCTFCHYGLAEVGTARYRERPTETVLDHLAAMKQRYGTRIVYFSQDVFSPRIAENIARGITARGLDLKWGTDMRPERSLTPERCATLVKGGALAAALGVESASPRVLALIDKGMPAETVRDAIRNLSGAGVAVEAMCFSDFPTETYREGMDSVRFVDALRDDLSLFILGRFDLTHGSLVAQKPGEFGISEVWHVEGDELGTGLFFAEQRQTKTAAQNEKLETAVRSLSAHWHLRRYPWAGALSTAHTLLWYLRHGKAAFRQMAATNSFEVPGARARTDKARFDVADVCETSAAREGEIWESLVYVERRVSREAYAAHAQRLPHAKPSRGTWTSLAGEEPAAVAAVRPVRKRSTNSGGRRSSSTARRTKP